MDYLYKLSKEAILDEIEARELNVSASDLDGIIENLSRAMLDKIISATSQAVDEYEEAIK